MRGEVLHYDDAQGFGFITGSDGNRYTFRREDMRRAVPLSKGVTVEFEPNAGQAKGVFPIHSAIAAGPTGPAIPAGPTGPAIPAGPQHFGRHAVADAPVSTGLWDYFWRSLTANYVNFRERARRKEYWGYFLFWSIGLLVLMFAGIAVDSATNGFGGGDMPIATVILSVGFVLATLLPSLAVTVRRIHDIGLSGWFYLLVFIPYVGSLIVFVFSLIPSQQHDNKWGPVPPGIQIRPPYIPPQAGQPPATPPAA